VFEIVAVVKTSCLPSALMEGLPQSRPHRTPGARCRQGNRYWGTLGSPGGGRAGTACGVDLLGYHAASIADIDIAVVDLVLGFERMHVVRGSQNAPAEKSSPDR